MLIINLLEFLIEPCSAETGVDCLEFREDARKKFLKRERGEIGGKQGVERGGGRGICGVESNAHDQVIVSR